MRGLSAARVARRSLGSFQPRLAELAQAARAVDLRGFETMPVDRAHGELHPIALRLVGDARRLVSEILAVCEARAGDAAGPPTPEEPFLPFERAMDAVVQSGDRTVRAVEDTSFLVQLELREREERLARIGARSGALALIGECDGSLRRIRKGLGAIDVALARVESIPAVIDFSSELEDSLVVRAAYAKLRRRLLGERPPDPAEIHARLRGIGTHIAMLVGWDAYPLLRVRDRLQLRELQQRILAWLLPGSSADRIAGLRLWQDVVAFAEMLALVNRRQELVEHDARLVSELARSTETAEVDVGALRRLEGLDDEIDGWVASKALPPRDALRDALGRLAQRFGGTA